MVWSFTAVPGSHYIGKPQQTNASRNACHWKFIMFVLCPKYRDLSSDCRVWTKWRVEWWMRTKFRRWWGIFWAFHTSICCEGVNLRKKLPSKLNLKTVQSAFRSQQKIVVNLVPGRDNTKDANAIRVVVSVQYQSLTIGYIEVRKIPKVTSAIQKCDIVSDLYLSKKMF